jgi:lipopolysaccharide biosynthesis protein
MSEKIKPIAIHLPQFHPIPENDEWWGKGFTEWTNVTKTTPRFEGHYQPHLPADLGFYDLRLEEARLAQEALAKAYGIHGFCYYHYWFNGKKMLYEPLDRKLKNPKEDFPFMMCWANEDWTRAWEASENKVLLKQDYGFDDDVNHIKHLINYFKDSRYIRVDDKPVFIVYRPELFPDIKKTIQIWREEAKKAGLPDLYLGYAQKSRLEFLSAGFDFAFQFQPNFSHVPKPIGNQTIKRIKRKVLLKMGIQENKQSSVYDYETYVKLQNAEDFKAPIYPGVTPMWDNSARKDKAFVLHDSTPKKYEKWLRFIKENYPWNEVPENFVFINAWNEWAEGNHLEPCQKWGTSYLEVTKEVFK